MLRVTRASKTGASSPVMKSSVVLVLVLVITGALAKPKAQGPSGFMGPPMGFPSGPAGPTGPPGYTYFIQATKTSTDVQNEDVLSYFGDAQLGQNISMNYPFDFNNPLFVEAELSNSGAGFSLTVSDLDSINTCTPEMYTEWQHLIAAIVVFGLSPPFICPMPPGYYTCLDEVPPLPITFPTKQPCGDYTLGIDFFRKEASILHADYEFSIADDGTCSNGDDDDDSTGGDDDSTGGDGDSTGDDGDSTGDDDDSTGGGQ